VYFSPLHARLLRIEKNIFIKNEKKSHFSVTNHEELTSMLIETTKNKLKNKLKKLKTL